MTASRIATSTGDAWLDEGGIIIFRCYKNAQLELEHAQENDKACAEVAGGEKRPLLVDMRQIAAMSKEARAHHSSIEESGAIYDAVALLVASPLSRVVGSIFMGLNKPGYPMKLFSSETKARKWLTIYLP